MLTRTAISTGCAPRGPARAMLVGLVPWRHLTPPPSLFPSCHHRHRWTTTNPHRRRCGASGVPALSSSPPLDHHESTPTARIFNPPATPDVLLTFRLALVCRTGWRGANCSLLHRLPAATRGDAAIYGLAPNRTSWGGNVILDPATGLHHLFVAEISGPNGSQCGLAAWGSHSTISHAVSKTGLQGPCTSPSSWTSLVPPSVVLVHAPVPLPPSLSLPPPPPPPPTPRRRS